MRLVVGEIALGMLLLGATPGCQSVGDPGELTPDSLLQAAESSRDAVTLDIYWARAAADDAQFHGTLWQSVQEDRIPVEVRRALAANGLRAGVVGGTPSEQVMQLLNPDGEPVTAGNKQEEHQVVATPGKVSRRLLQLRPGRRAEIQAGDTPRTMPLLRRQNGELVGRSYPDAQGIYGLTVLARDQNEVRLELAPEVHYGKPRMKIQQGPGMVVQRLAREVEKFADLRTEVQLAPGEILLVSCLPESSNRVGGLFHHADPQQGPEQKYLLVRLSQVPESQALAATGDTAWPWR